MRELLAHTRGKHHVIFDWNGTLLDDVDTCVGIIGKIMHRRGLSPIDRDAYLECFRFPVLDYYKQLGFDFEVASFEELSKEFICAYKEHLADVPLHAGVQAALQELAEAGIDRSVLSAAHERHLEAQLARYGLKQHFTHIYGLSDNYAHSKIARGHQLLEQLGVPPEHLLLIGDTDHDAEVADSLGIDVLLVTGGHQSEARLRAGGRQVLVR